jgi:glutamate/tyrosine decarboxylase-like PLP-dependent enzyme
MTGEANAALPEIGEKWDELRRQLTERQLHPIRAHWGRAFRGPPEVQDVGRIVYEMFLADNGIFSLRAPYLMDIEQDVLAMCASLLNPETQTCGNFTSGGSESIFSALHAMRSWAKARRPEIQLPEVIAPYSTHPSVSKGCHYLGIRLVRTALGGDYRADVHAMQREINSNTIGVVASAPCWPFGLFDPIEDIALLASQHGLWMHVDACVGGYLAPFVEQLGVDLPAWDFRVSGVMSISADLHKYGYCPKPASTIFWRSSELQEFHFVHPTDWPGGQYSTTGFVGSRSAGPIFAAWVILKYLGRSGYRQLARQLLKDKEELCEGIRAIEGLEVFKNDLFPVAFGSRIADLQVIAQGLTDLGWIMLGCKQPPLINVPLDAAAHGVVVETFLTDLRSVTKAAVAGTMHAKGRLEY